VIEENVIDRAATAIKMIALGVKLRSLQEAKGRWEKDPKQLY
jgi:hypothetical protein